MVSGLSPYTILTADARESSQLQNDLFVPSNQLIPVTVLHRGHLDRAAGKGAPLYYTNDALDALVRSAATVAAYEGTAVYAEADTPWRAWRRNRTRFSRIRPLEAWLHLNETSREELAERFRVNHEVITAHTRIPAARLSLSQLDLIGLERRRVAAMVRSNAADRLIRIAPARIVITETMNDTETELTIRATWTALSAAERREPEWLADGLDAEQLQAI